MKRATSESKQRHEIRYHESNNDHNRNNIKMTHQRLRRQRKLISRDQCDDNWEKKILRRLSPEFPPASFPTRPRCRRRRCRCQRVTVAVVVGCVGISASTREAPVGSSSLTCKLSVWSSHFLTLSWMPQISSRRVWPWQWGLSWLQVVVEASSVVTGWELPNANRFCYSWAYRSKFMHPKK